MHTFGMEPTITLITLNPGRVGLLTGVAASTVVAASFCIFPLPRRRRQLALEGHEEGREVFRPFREVGFSWQISADDSCARFLGSI